MDLSIQRAMASASLAREAEAMEKLNEITARYGLTLTRGQIDALLDARFDALTDSGRVEFGGGILKKLALAICDSPYVPASDYFDTLLTLQELFYAFKNEAGDAFSDDDLIEKMADYLNGECAGSLEALSESSLYELCREARGGFAR